MKLISVLLRAIFIITVGLFPLVFIVTNGLEVKYAVFYYFIEAIILAIFAGLRALLAKGDDNYVAWLASQEKATSRQVFTLTILFIPAAFSALLPLSYTLFDDIDLSAISIFVGLSLAGQAYFLFEEYSGGIFEKIGPVKAASKGIINAFFALGVLLFLLFTTTPDLREVDALSLLAGFVVIKMTLSFLFEFKIL